MNRQEGAIVFQGVGIAGQTTVLQYTTSKMFAPRGINQISPDCVLVDFFRSVMHGNNEPVPAGTTVMIRVEDQRRRGPFRRIVVIVGGEWLIEEEDSKP